MPAASTYAAPFRAGQRALGVVDTLEEVLVVVIMGVVAAALVCDVADDDAAEELIEPLEPLPNTSTAESAPGPADTEVIAGLK